MTEVCAAVPSEFKQASINVSLSDVEKAFRKGNEVTDRKSAATKTLGIKQEMTKQIRHVQEEFEALNISRCFYENSSKSM